MNDDAVVCVALVWGLVVTVFWMIVGWRAMRAHEEIATDVRWVRQIWVALNAEDGGDTED